MLLHGIRPLTWLSQEIETMVQFSRSLAAWATPEFPALLKQEIEQLPASELPLQQGLASSSYVTDQPFQAMVISVHEGASRLYVKAGIFYSGIIAGCSCADDPTPIGEETEYCVVQFDIDRQTGVARVALLDE